MIDSPEKEVRILKKGKWFQHNGQIMDIQIIRQNWDYYYEQEYDPDPPDLNEDGEAYYLILGDYINVRDARRSRTCLSLEEVFSLAKEILPGKIEWVE